MLKGKGKSVLSIFVLDFTELMVSKTFSVEMTLMSPLNRDAAITFSDGKHPYSLQRFIPDTLLVCFDDDDLVRKIILNKHSQSQHECDGSLTC